MATNDHEIVTKVSRMNDSIDFFKKTLAKYGDPSNAEVEELEKELEGVKEELEELEGIYGRLDDSKKQIIERQTRDMLNMLGRKLDKIKCAIVDIALSVSSRSGGSNQIPNADTSDLEGVSSMNSLQVQNSSRGVSSVDSLQVQDASGDLEAVSAMDSPQVQQPSGDLEGVSSTDSLQVQLPSGDLEGASTMDDLDMHLPGDAQGVSTLADFRQQEFIGFTMGSKDPREIENPNRLSHLNEYKSRLERTIIDLAREKKELEELQKRLNEISIRCHQSDKRERENILKDLKELKIQLDHIKDVSGSCRKLGVGSSSSAGPSKDVDGVKMDTKLNQSGEGSGVRTDIEGKGKEVIDVASDSPESEHIIDPDEEMRKFLEEVQKYEELEELR